MYSLNRSWVTQPVRSIPLFLKRRPFWAILCYVSALERPLVLLQITPLGRLHALGQEAFRAWVTH